MLHKIKADQRNIFLGKSGEEIAESFLENLRFRILERNFRTPFGEIDLIALEKDTLVFIEVKTRISKNFGPPSLSITDKKKKTIIKNAMYYLKRFCLFGTDVRIDVIAINLNIACEFEKLEHLKSAIWIEER